MFKNDIQLNFMQRVKESIQSSLLTHLKKYQSHLVKRLIAFNSISLLIFLLSFYFIRITEHGSFMNFSSFILLIISPVTMITITFLDTTEIIYIRNLKKKLPLSTKDMKWAVKQHIDTSIFHLTTAEINELFSLNLIPNQLTYLQKKILNDSHLTFEDLENLSSILSDEDQILMKEKEKQQHLLNQEQTLNNFFLQHGLSLENNAKMITENLKKEANLTEKEIELTSRL